MRPEARAEKLVNEALDCEIAGKWDAAAEKWGAASLASQRRKKEFAKRAADCTAKGTPSVSAVEPGDEVARLRKANEDAAALLEEAMGEITRLQKETPEVGHLQAQIYELQEEVKRLQKRPTERGLGCVRSCPDCDGADDCPCVACHGPAPTVRAQIDLRGSEEVQRLLNEAQVEIEGLQDKLAALPRQEEWKRIQGLLGPDAEDAETIADILQNVRNSLGTELDGNHLDEAVDSALKTDEEDQAKAAAFDRCKGGLSLELADALRKVLSSHACPLRHAWLGLDVYAQKQIMSAMEDQIETWLDGDCK